MKHDFKKAFQSNHADVSAEIYGWELPAGPETVEAIDGIDGVKS